MSHADRRIGAFSLRLFGLAVATIAIGALPADVQAQPFSAAQEQAGRLLADMYACGVDKTTNDLTTRKVSDWYFHTQNGKNELSCTRDSKCGMAADLAMPFLCARVLCSGMPPPAPPNCATFMPRFKAMKLLRDDWRPADGLK